MTTSHIAQTPSQTLQTTPHKLGPERLNLTQPGNQTQALGDKSPTQPQPHNQTQLCTPRLTTQPNRAQSSQAHTGETRGPKATSPTTHVTPTTTTHIPHPHSPPVSVPQGSRTPAPQPLPGPPQSAALPLARRPTGSSGPDSGPWRSLTQQPPPSPSAARRSAGAPARHRNRKTG